MRVYRGTIVQYKVLGHTILYPYEKPQGIALVANLTPILEALAG